MLYAEWKIGEKEPLKLRLRAKDCVQLEKALGTNPLNIMVHMETKEELPELASIIAILHASMQACHHGIKMDDVLSYYDEYIEAGGSQMELLEVVADIFDVSGFLPKDRDEDSEKNATGAE